MGVATAVAVGGAIVGGIAGGMKDNSSGSSSSSSGVNLGQASDLENQGTDVSGKSLTDITNMVNAGPGQNDVTNAYNQQGSFASMLSDYARTGGAASSQDISQAQASAKLQFAPQQVALDQSFKDEQLRANQMAAQLGRPVNDPYIQAQLSKQRMNNQQMLAANQGAYVDQASRQNSMARLGYTQQLTDVQNSLASQAMSNRQALLSLGQGVQQSERNFRLQTGTRWGNSQYDQSSGGGMKGALTGAIGGAGAGMGFASALGGMGGGQKPQMLTGGNQFQNGVEGDMPVSYGSSQYGPPSPMGLQPSPLGATSYSYSGPSTGGYRQSPIQQSWGYGKQVPY